MSITLETLRPSRIEDLLSLLRKNLKSNLDPSSAGKQGFLTFEYTPQEIALMMQDMPQPVAKEEDEVIGYALASSKQACSQIGLLKPVLEISDSLPFKGKLLGDQKYYVLGQICVSAEWRGQGVFDALYKKHKELFSKEYDCVATEIATSNLRSLASHQRVGFEIIHYYKDANEIEWAMVAWDWN